METVLITGGTGLIGQALTQLLTDHGYQVIILSRQPHADKNTENSLVTYAGWDVRRQTVDTDALAAADHIVHLAGANVGGKRWTSSYKKEILESRTLSSQLLFKALEQHPNKVKKFISASATGYYGNYDNNKSPFTETSPAAGDFLGTTCQAWENSVREVESLGKQVVIFRTGIVLSKKGGALKEFYKPLQFGFATILGNGEQWISWIHLQDLVRLYFNAIVNPQLQGIFNAVAPQPVTNKTMMIELGNRMKKNFYISLPVPGFVLRLLLGEKSTEVLKSNNVSCEKIKKQGFQFIYPTLDAALRDLLHR